MDKLNIMYKQFYFKIKILIMDNWILWRSMYDSSIRAHMVVKRENTRKDP
jgi:hypothetical protein